MDSESGVPPFTGSFLRGPAGFVDAAQGDLRLGAGSAFRDVIPSGVEVPSLDFASWPRPAGGAADVGALEPQPRGLRRRG